MWGGFNLGNISQLGNQLGEALQKAKHEIDNKLDQTFTFDDKPVERASDPASYDADEFTVDANGLFIATGHAASKQVTTAKSPSTTPKHKQTSANTEQQLNTPASNQQNGQAQPIAQDNPKQSTESVVDVPVEQQHAGSAASAAGTDSGSSKPTRKKVVKKIVRRVKADEDSAVGVDHSHAAPSAQLAHDGTVAGNTNQTCSSATSADAAGAASDSLSQATHSTAPSVPVADFAGQGQPAEEQHKPSKQKKSLLGATKLAHQPEPATAPVHQQRDNEQPEHHPQQQEQLQQQYAPDAEQQGAVAQQQEQDQQLQFLQSQVQAASSNVSNTIATQQLDTDAACQQQQQLSVQEQQIELQQLEDGWSQDADLELQSVSEPGMVQELPEQQLRESQQQQELQQDQQQVAQHDTVQQAADATDSLNATAAGDACVDQVDSICQQESQQLQQQQHDSIEQQQAADTAQELHVELQQPPEQDQQMPGQQEKDQQPQQQQQQLPQQDQQNQQDQQHNARLISLLKQQCHELQQQLQQREGQLARQAERLGDLEAATAALSESKVELEQVVVALTAKNEQLVLRASAVNEQEMQEVQKEAAERLAAAERKVFALIKERDALKRAAAAAAASTGDGSSDVKKLEAELQKKDELVTQLMDEGQKLSKRQLELESTIKKLRQQFKASQADQEKLNALLAAERAEAENLRRARVKAERDLVAAVESGRQELEAVRQQGEEQLLKAQADKATAEASAAEAATEGLAGQLKSSEARAAALAESVSELQEALDRQRAAADMREELLRQDLSDLERRAQAAELRHQELSAKLPEATAPLLRQITSLQDASAAQAQAWAAAERSLTARVHEAEAAAAAAIDRERDTQERLAALQVRLAAAEQAATAARASAAEAAAKAARANERLALTEQQLEDAQAAAEEVQAEAARLSEDLKQQEQSHIRKLSNESAARRAAEDELMHSRQELSQLRGVMGTGMTPAGFGSLQHPGPGLAAGFGVPTAPGQQSSDAWRATAGPPALAAPGFRWVLVREGSDAGAAATANGDDAASSVPGTPHSGGSAAAGGSKLIGQGSSASSVVAAGFFDTNELLQSDAASLSGAAGALGAASASTALSPTSSGVMQLHQAQLKAAQQRLGGGNVGEAQLQRFRAALRQKVGECAALEARVRELEQTRDQLAGELVQATQDAAKAADAVVELPKLQQALKDVEARYAAAVELVGERDEQLEEMANDLEDVKQLYRQQIETLLGQLAQTDSS